MLDLTQKKIPLKKIPTTIQAAGKILPKYIRHDLKGIPKESSDETLLMDLG